MATAGQPQRVSLAHHGSKFTFSTVHPFSPLSSSSFTAQQELTDILAKVANEGRSAGFHTQQNSKRAITPRPVGAGGASQRLFNRRTISSPSPVPEEVFFV